MFSSCIHVYDDVTLPDVSVRFVYIYRLELSCIPYTVLNVQIRKRNVYARWHLTSTCTSSALSCGLLHNTIIAELIEDVNTMQSAIYISLQIHIHGPVIDAWEIYSTYRIT